MMNLKLRRLAEQRKNLVAEAEAQRLLLIDNVEPLRSTLLLADKGLSAIHYINSHRAWVASSSLALLTVVRPSRIGKWFRRGWLAWQMVRKLRS
jgi:hypothetical protein